MYFLVKQILNMSSDFHTKQHAYSNFHSLWPYNHYLAIMPHNQTSGGIRPYHPFTGQDIIEALSEEQEIQIFAKQMLINRLFLGHYQERRFVDSLESYRDVVIVGPAENDLKNDLQTVRKRLKNFYKFSKMWVGITGPDFIGAPAGHALWVKLRDVPFGHYWFQIKQVKIVEGRELALRVKCIRPVSSGFADVEEITESEASQDPSEQNLAGSDVSIDWDKVKGKWKGAAEDALTRLTTVVTVHNLKEVICFTSVLLAACVTGLFHSVRYIGDYSIKFMREFSIFIQSATPIFLAVIDFFGKCIGGLYLLIAMLWRGQQPPPPNFRPYQRPMPMLQDAPYKYRR